MKILVTGGSGFVGQELLKLLSDRYDVTNVDIVRSAFPVNEITHDLTTPLHLSEKFDVCIHLASGTGGILFNQRSDIIEYNNAINYNTAEICKDSLFIFISSINVFEDSNSVLNEIPMIMPQNMYAQAKWHGERFFNDNIQNLKIVRPSNILGKSQISHFTSYGESHVVPDLYHKIMNADKEIEIWGDGSQIRNFIHVSDLCNVLHSLIYLFNRVDKCINVISKIQPTIKELALNLMEYAQKHVSMKFCPEYMKYEKVPYERIFSQITPCGFIDNLQKGLSI